MTLFITGGSGFIGTALITRLLQRGDRVINVDRILSRITHERLTTIISDFSDDRWKDELYQADAIIHLAGASIFNRWTSTYQQEIISSRVMPAEKIADALKLSSHHVKVYISASAIGYYGDTGDMLVTESHNSGNDFLSQVCIAWEHTRNLFESQGIRSVSVRTAIVLGPDGGMMKKIIPLFRWGLGGILGSGNQWFSWIHIDDLVKVYLFILDHPEITGAVNATAPEPVTNKVFTKTLALSMQRPTWFRIPKWVLRIALGKFADAILASQRVAPEKLEHHGFVFTYDSLEKAL